jgi:hypothetical protein
MRLARLEEKVRKPKLEPTELDETMTNLDDARSSTLHLLKDEEVGDSVEIDVTP